MQSLKKFKIGWSDLIILFLMIGIFANNQIRLSLSHTQHQSQNIPTLEFAVIIKDSEDPFWIEFKKGAGKAAVFYQASLDTTYLKARGQIDSAFNEAALIDKATVAGVDGIITYIETQTGVEVLIDQAAESNIPIITLENDVPGSKRTSFVGYNAYRFGQEAGKKLREGLAGKGKIAIIMNRNETAEQNSQNLKISGFLNEINQNNGMEVVEYIISDNGLFSTQDLVSKLIHAEVPIDGLFITNSIDTESISQLLIDNNLVGKYQVVGTGNSEEIAKYVDKHILFASVYVNAYEMGYKCVETLAKIKANQPVPSYIDTTIGILSGDSSSENIK